MRDALPIVKDLRRLGKVSKPVGKTARLVLESFEKGRGIQRLLDYVFYQVAADQRLRLLRPLPARAPDPQHLLALLHARRRGLLEQVRRERGAVVGRQRHRRRRGRQPGPRAHLRRAGRQGPRQRRTRSHTAAPTAKRQAHRQPGHGGSTGTRQGAGGGSGRPDRTPADHGAGAGNTNAAKPTRPARSSTTSSARTADEEPRLLHRRQPGPDRRRHGARGHRRDVPVLQRQRGPAVRPDLPAQGRGAERRGARQGQRGAHRRRPRRRRRHDHDAPPQGRLERRASSA